MSNLIAHVTVFLEHDKPEFMDGIYRCESVISCDADGNQLSDHKELVDNSEFHSVEDLRRYIAKRLNVSEDIVFIEGRVWP